MEAEKFTKIVDVNCRFCGKKTGEIGVYDEKAHVAQIIDEHKDEIRKREEAIEALKNPEHTKDMAVDEIVEARMTHKGAIKHATESIEKFQKHHDSLSGIDHKLTPEAHNVADSRCDDCEKEHGSYKEMHDHALRAGLSHDEFIKEIKETGFKKAGFHDRIESVVVVKKVAADMLANSRKTEDEKRTREEKAAGKVTDPDNKKPGPKK